MRQRFFSFVIPAHNEERCIGQTLEALQKLAYPQDAYEVIVIENASTDGTALIAKGYESANVRVHSIPEKGISLARNVGLALASGSREWSIVMDADTLLKPSFLNELNAYLEAHPKATHGMARLTPDPYTWKSRFWYGYRNLNDWIIQTMDTVHIVRNDLLSKARYPEDFEFTEDLQYAASLKQYGGYFFLPSKSVISSARRFEQVGYVRMFLKNFKIGLVYALNPSRNKGKEWGVIR